MIPFGYEKEYLKQKTEETPLLINEKPEQELLLINEKQQEFDQSLFNKITYYYLNEVEPIKNKTIKNCPCGQKFTFILEPKYNCSMCGEIYCYNCLNFYPKNLIFTNFPFNEKFTFFIQLWATNNSHNIHSRIAMTSSWLKVCKKCYKNIKQCLLTMYTEQETLFIIRMAKLVWQSVNFEK
jgi:hypothetical protein